MTIQPVLAARRSRVQALARALAQAFAGRFGLGAAQGPTVDGGGGGFLPFIVAVMAFLATLALATALAIGAAAGRYDVALTGGATVQIPPPPPSVQTPAPSGRAPSTAASAPAPSDAMDKRVEAALIVLRDTAGVIAAEAMDRARAAQLLTPWLGDAALSPDLPMPRLIDVTFRADRLDQEALARRLAAAVPGARFDDHRRWVDGLRRLAATAVAGAFAVVGLVAAVAAVAVIFATRSALAIQRDTIEVLHLIGATDRYIADSFARRTFWRAGLGAVLGQSLAVAGLIAAAAALLDRDGGGLPALDLDPLQWMLIALVTPATAAVAALTARATVLARLRRGL